MIDPFEVKRKFIDEVRKYAKSGLADELKKAPKGAVEIVISSAEAKPHDEEGEGPVEESGEGEHSEVKELAAVRENGHHLPCQCPACKMESEAGGEGEDEGAVHSLKSLLSK